MRFTPTHIEGCVIVDLEPHEDDRGWFARAHCARELAEAGLDGHVAQVNLVHNDRAGTLRGLHLQRPPHAEAKLIRCVRGTILDVAVDVREGSPTRHRHVAVELSAATGRALYVGAGLAHGYQTLVDDTDVLYTTSAAYAPHAEAGLRHDDPALAIPWPRPVTTISAKDRDWPLIGS